MEKCRFWCAGVLLCPWVTGWQLYYLAKENKRKHTAGITVLLQIVFCLHHNLFSCDDTNLAIYFLPCFAFAILPAVFDAVSDM